MGDTTIDNFGHDPHDDNPDRQPDPLGLIGQVIAGKYRIEEFIGEGGFGKVYTGINVNLVEQKIVIKFFTQAKLRDRFDKEAQIICKLDHPGICSLIDYLPVERALVIPFIDGIDLNQCLKDSGPLPAEQFLRISRAVLDAVEFAHSKSIAHRDIKPSNIMIGKNDNVYLIDFGIAKEIKDSATNTTFFLGTPDFAAPERRKGRPEYNPFISDVYELGITLFYLATKKNLYQDSDNPDPDDWDLPGADKLSPQLRRVLKKATDPNPGERYQSISEMREDFLGIGNPYRRSSAAMRNALIAAVILVIIVGFDAINQRYSLSELPALIPWSSNPAETITEKSPDSIPAVINVPIVDEPGEDTVAAVEEEPVEDTAMPPDPIILPPVVPQMKIDILPAGLVHMEVDNKDQTPGLYFETTPGQREIVIEHSQFPIYRTFVSVSGDTSRLTFDLRDRFPVLDSTNVILITLPRDEDFGFDLFCNGEVYRFDRQREFGFHLKNGEWQIAASVRPLVSGSASEQVVDSIVVGVVGKTMTRTITGRSGLLNVSSGPARDQKMRLLIYWSETDENAER